MKNKTILYYLILLCSLTACSNKPPVFGDTSQLAVNIAQVKMFPNDSYITLEGYILEQLNPDHYLLKDNTGDKIQVEIKDGVWNGLSLTPNDKIRIQGKLNRCLFNTWLSGYWIEKAN